MLQSLQRSLLSITCRLLILHKIGIASLNRALPRLFSCPPVTFSLSNDLGLPRPRPLGPLPPPQEEDEGEELEEGEDGDGDEDGRPLGQDIGRHLAAKFVCVAEVADDLAARGEAARDLKHVH